MLSIIAVFLLPLGCYEAIIICMNEQLDINNRETNPQGRSLNSWLADWASMLSVVLLSGSSLSCAFNWLAYGYAWDAVAFCFSLVLALVVYFAAFNAKRQPSISRRISISLASIVIWAAFLPIILQIAGYQSF